MVFLTFLGGFFVIKLYSGKEKYRIPVAIYTLINYVTIIVMMSLTIVNGINVYVITTNAIGVSLEMRIV